MRPFGDRMIVDSTTPHGWFAAEYVALLRNMLVREAGLALGQRDVGHPRCVPAGEQVSVPSRARPTGDVAFLAHQPPQRRDAHVDATRLARGPAPVPRPGRGAQRQRPGPQPRTAS